MKPLHIRVGCAGWSLPRSEQERFLGAGSHLERYAARFPAVEINSSFHRPHRPATYERWALSVPPSFRFSVKVPKAITHGLRLRAAEELLDSFLAEAGHLGDKLRCLLVQLPPSLELEAAVADSFFTAALRSRSPVAVACEPRHSSWFTPEAEELLKRLGVARVAADPARVPAAAEPGGWPGLRYYRLHGSPKIYYSAYSEDYLDALASRLREDASGGPVWCIFDNTTLGAATGNALGLLSQLGMTER
jgi:uncharacterized protein YecE (DUF72 family)